MRRNSILSCLVALFMFTLLATRAQADVQYGVGFLSIDIPDTAGDLNSYELDITNLTALNDTQGGALTGNPSVDPFPVSTQLLTDVSSLTVTAADGTTVMATLGPAYFSLAADGQSLYGGGLPLNDASPSSTPGSVVLTGTFSTTTIQLDDGSFVTILPGFTATLTDCCGFILMDQDAVEIFATLAPSVIPEPSYGVLLGIGLLLLVGFKIRRTGFSSTKLQGIALLAVLCLVSVSSVHAATVVPPRLTTWTVPSSGVAGTTTVFVTSENTPSGLTTANTTLSFASTCGGTPIATVSPSSVTVEIPTIDRIGVLIPSALSLTGDYYISLDANGIPSSNCSEVTVTVPIKFSGACLPSSSIGLSISTANTVTAYVPNGAWDHGPAGLQVVPLEPAPLGIPVSVPTPNIVNACSSSPTGQAVCTANNTDVYILSGSTLTTTLTSGSNTTDGFSGGSCNNCGVAINPNTNQAVISMGLAGFAGGYQFLNLGASPSFVGAPIGVAHEPSENVVWDATRDLILAPNEYQANYDVIQVGKGSTTIAEFGAAIPNPDGGEPDSAGEDCSTGIAISTIEFTDTLFFTDLTQAVFTPGSPAGTWSAPGQTLTFPEFSGLGAGTSGTAVAPGSHLAVVAGEFGGDSFGVVQLPAVSGSGTPAPVDYVQAYLPAEPNGCSFEAGYDPHTVTAYTSPNTGKVLAVMADGDGVAPGYLALVDMAALLAAPRTAGTHSVSSSVNLLTSGIVTYVSTGNTVAPCDAPADRIGDRPALEKRASPLAPTQLNHR